MKNIFKEIFNTDFGMSKQRRSLEGLRPQVMMSRVQPLPNYRSDVEELNQQVQAIQNIFQNEKSRVQTMETYSRQCEKMLQDNYKRYDPRADISPEDRKQQALRGNPDVAEQERVQQEVAAWRKFMHTGHGSAHNPQTSEASNSPRKKKWYEDEKTYWETLEADNKRRNNEVMYNDWTGTHERYRHKTHQKFIQPLFKSSQYMGHEATNPYVVLTAAGPAEAASGPDEAASGTAEAASATLRPRPEFETKIQTLTQQVKDLNKNVKEWKEKTEDLYNKYLDMNNTLKYQQEFYGLKQPPPSKGACG